MPELLLMSRRSSFSVVNAMMSHGSRIYMPEAAGTGEPYFAENCVDLAPVKLIRLGGHFLRHTLRPALSRQLPRTARRHRRQIPTDLGRFDAIFADPPYFLSNGGITCHAGKMVKVDKGDWDKSRGAELNHEFNLEWLKRCQRVLKPNGTIWVSGTHHVIFSIGYAMQQLGYKILNDIAWEKPNPPPNLSCRYFTHSTETILWAAKNEKSKHVFNYQEMRKVTGKQMKTVWRQRMSSGVRRKSSG
jgi:hypothetical protein